MLLLLESVHIYCDNINLKKIKYYISIILTVDLRRCTVQAYFILMRLELRFKIIKLMQP